MSAAHVLLAELRQLGVEVKVQGDRIRFRPATAVPVDLRERIRSLKSEVVAELRALKPGEPTDPLVGVQRDSRAPDSPSIQLDRCWRRAVAEAIRGFADAGTTPDPKCLEVAAFALLELDDDAPPGCRTERMRADAGKVHRWLESVYLRGSTECELLPNGSLSTLGFLDE